MLRIREIYSSPRSKLTVLMPLARTRLVLPTASECSPRLWWCLVNISFGQSTTWKTFSSYSEAFSVGWFLFVSPASAAWIKSCLLTSVFCSACRHQLPSSAQTADPWLSDGERRELWKRKGVKLTLDQGVGQRDNMGIPVTHRGRGCT